MLLASLNPAAVADGADIADAVRIDGAVLSRSDLVGAATSVAERVGGAQRVAVLATPTATTVLAVTGCLIAGVPVVPVPADVGTAERRHIVTDSGAQAWLGERPDEPEGLPHIPVRLHARSWHRYRRAVAGGHRADHVHLGHDGPAEGRRAERRRSRPIWTGSPMRGSGPPTTRSCTASRCSTCTDSCSGCSGRCESDPASSTRAVPCPAGMRPPAVRCTSACRPCGRAWSPIRRGAALSSARLLVSGSAPLPVPVFEKIAALTGHKPMERYGMTETLITVTTRPRRARPGGWGYR